MLPASTNDMNNLHSSTAFGTVIWHQKFRAVTQQAFNAEIISASNTSGSRLKFDPPTLSPWKQACRVIPALLSPINKPSPAPAMPQNRQQRDRIDNNEYQLRHNKRHIAEKHPHDKKQRSVIARAPRHTHTDYQRHI